jgi:hypothetical protein
VDPGQGWQEFSAGFTFLKSTNPHRGGGMLFLHCADVEQELEALGFNYELCDVEDDPTLAEKFSIRHRPTLILDEHRGSPMRTM